MEQTIQLPLGQLLLILVGGLIGLVQLLIGWFLRSLFDRIKALESEDKNVGKKLEEILIALPTHYVSKEEFTKALDNIFNAIRRVEDKIESIRGE